METAVEPSSTRMILSHASASSYPPPAAVPLTAARYVWPECSVASSIAARVSLVNLQKFTYHQSSDCASIRTLAPPQNTLSSPPVMTTARNPGPSNPTRCTEPANAI